MTNRNSLSCCHPAYRIFLASTFRPYFRNCMSFGKSFIFKWLMTLCHVNIYKRLLWVIRWGEVLCLIKLNLGRGDSLVPLVPQRSPWMWELSSLSSVSPDPKMQRAWKHLLNDLVALHTEHPQVSLNWSEFLQWQTCYLVLIKWNQGIISFDGHCEVCIPLRTNFSKAAKPSSQRRLSLSKRIQLQFKHFSRLQNTKFEGNVKYLYK